MYRDQSCRGRRVALVALAGFLGAPVFAQRAARSAGLESPPLRPPAAPGDGACATCGVGGPLADANLATGEVRLRVTDLEVTGVGLDFVWVRTYRSRAETDTAQGHNWDFAYDVWIERGPHEVIVHDGGGRADHYRPDASGRYVCPEQFRIGSIDGGGAFTLTFEDNGRWVFFALDGSARGGKIARSEDRNGNALAFNYDANGKLTRVDDTLGRPITIAYDLDGRVAAVTDFTGRSYVYRYYRAGDGGGSAGDLASVTTPKVTGTPNGNDFPLGKTTTYTYSRGFLDERLNHNLLSITDAKGQTAIVNSYATTLDTSELAFDRLVARSLGIPAQRIDIVYTRPSRSIEGGGQGATQRVIVNDRAGNVEEWFYDAHGRPILRREFTGRASKSGPTTEFENRPKDPLRASDPAFFATRWSWTDDAQLSTQVFADGSSERHVYEAEIDAGADPRARGNRRETHLLPAPGSHADQSELVWQWEYDQGFGGCCGSNFVTRGVDPRGNVTQHTYDAHGNRLRTVYPIASITESFTYDERGRKIEQVLPDPGCGQQPRVDRWTYYGPADGAQNGYLKNTVVDALGLALTMTFEHDALGRSVRVIDEQGRDRLLAFNALGQVMRETLNVVDAKNTRYQVDRFFDLGDNLVQVDALLVDADGSVMPNSHLTKRFTYDALNRKVKTEREVDESRFVAEETAYDANGNETLTRFGEAVAGRQPDNVVRRTWDERDHPFQLVRGEGGPDQSTTQFDYDLSGDLVRRVEGLEHGGEEQLYVHDGLHRVLASLDAMGNERSFSYDANGNVVRQVVRGELDDRDGGSANVRISDVTFLYDAMDRKVGVVTQWFDPQSQAPIGRGSVTASLDFNGTGDLLRTTDEGGHATQYCYDTAGRLASQVDALGNAVRYVYDRSSNLIETTEEEREADGSVTRYVTSNQYDGMNRCIKRVDAQGNVTTWAYDSRDLPERMVDARGNRHVLTWDGLDRLTRATIELTKDGTGGSSKIGEVAIEQEFDDSSRVIERRDPNGNATRWTYDAQNRPVEVRFADGSVRTCIYDGFGNEVVAVEADLSVVKSEFDRTHRCIGRELTPGPGVSADTTHEQYAWDGLGQLMFAADDDSTVARTYDSRSLLVSEDQQGAPFHYSYDEAGNAIACQYPGGRTIVHTYDALDRLDQVREGGVTLADYDFAGPGRLVRCTLPKIGATGAFQYDLARRPITWRHTRGTTVIDDRAFAWDAASDRSHREDRRTNNRFEDFAYDSARRMVRSLLSARTGVVDDIRYTLDATGNRTQVSGGSCAGAYTMDPGQPEPADLPMNQYSRTPCDDRTYDAAGDLVGVAVGSSAVSLTYDVHHRLVKRCDSASGACTTYRYDVFGRRTEREVTGASPDRVRSLYSGFALCEERAGDGSVRATYVHGAGGPLTMRRQDSDFWLFADDMHSVRAVVNQSGAVVERYEYGDFGAPSFFDGSGHPLAQSSIGNPLLYIGGVWDQDSSLYWLQARYLEPKTGRFLTRDPLGIWGDRAQRGNATQYAGNNPQTFRDPTGLATEIAITIGGSWPAPRTFYLLTHDCNSSKRSSIISMASPAFIALGRAAIDVMNMNWTEYLGQGIPGVTASNSGIVQSRVNRWFGGSDGVTSDGSETFIEDRLLETWHGLRDEETSITCASSSDSTCNGANAYVIDYGLIHGDVHLCPSWFSGGQSTRASIFLHELTHKYAGTADEFYYMSSGNPSAIPGGSASESELRDNADTYEQFFLEFYINKPWPSWIIRSDILWKIKKFF